MYSFYNNDVIYKYRVNISEILRVFIPLSYSFVASFYENSVYYFDFNNSNELKSLKEHNKSIYSLIKLSSNRLASGSVDGMIKIWSDASSTSLLTINAYDNTMIISMLEIPDQKMLIVSGNTEVIKVFHSENGSSLFDLEGHTSSVPTIELINDKRLISCSFDKSIRLWDLNKKACDVMIKDVFNLPRFIFQLPNNSIYGIYYKGTWEQLSVFDNLSTIEKEKRIIISEKDGVVTLNLKGLSLL